MHSHIFVAGTFDHLHAGHKAVLERAVIEGEAITVGITSEEFLHEYKPHLFEHGHNIPQSFEERKHNVEAYVKTVLEQGNINYIAIDNPFSPADTDPSYDALIITTDNKVTGEEINKKRQEKHLPLLILIEVDKVPAVDGQDLSSTRIRLGEINTTGELVLPDYLRESLKVPLGDVFPHEQAQQAFKHKEDQLFVTVGDMTTLHAREQGILPDLSIIDYLVERKPFKQWEDFHFPDTVTQIELQSGPGFIASEVWSVIIEWEKQRKPTVIQITGEDDLLVLPIVSVLPNDSLVFYGQPGEGIVRVEITDHIKETIHQFLESFTM
jgi:cytidyltransferase-like protein